MPFITKDRRLLIDSKKLSPQDFQPGDHCYVHYTSMVAKWRASPRWTTAAKIYENDVLSITMTREQAAAAQLAWQVFFNLYVMPYEQKKRVENGDI